MTTLNKVIVIWGTLIFLYLVVANRAGTASALTGITNFSTGVTKALQGR
jgi:hypothetical protein